MSEIFYYIWVDDERPIPSYIKDIKNCSVIICTTYKQAVAALNVFCSNEKVYLDLDHDLGCKQSGYDIAKYVIENHFPLYGFSCHSMNPIGEKEY